MLLSLLFRKKTAGRSAATAETLCFGIEARKITARNSPDNDEKQ
jgi:hypothetical protein